jgi:hypothetical protein
VAAQSAEYAIKNKRLTNQVALEELVTVLEKLECIKDKEKIPAIKKKFFDRLVLTKEVKEEFQRFKKYAQQQKIKQGKIQHEEIQKQKRENKKIEQELQRARILKQVEQELQQADEYIRQQKINQRKIQQEEIRKQKREYQKLQRKFQQQFQQEFQKKSYPEQLVGVLRQQNRDFLESIKQTPRFEEFQQQLNAVADGWRWFRGPSEEWKSTVMLLAFQLLKPYRDRSKHEESNCTVLENYIFSSIRTVINAYNETCYFRVYDRDKLYYEIAARIKDLVQCSIMGIKRGPTLVDRLYGEGKLQFSLFMNGFLNKVREVKSGLSMNNILSKTKEAKNE